MRKIALLTLISLPLFAGFFPQTIETSLDKISDKNVHLSTPFPVDGMSGVVIHHYGNDLNAITSRIVQKNPSTAKLLVDDMIHHDKLPTINTEIKTGDKVIGGYLYDNVLLLAPDAKTYANITSKYQKTWIHPDLFALFLSKEGDNIPTKENLASFAKAYQVGLIFIVTKNKAKLLDPISGKIVAQQKMSNLPAKANAPFFMRLDKIDSGMFSSSTTESYYDIMKSL